jgi:hypothetical protein
VSVVRSFHDLDVYQKAYQLSLDIHKATLGFPKPRAVCTNRSNASKSICANLAEGFAKQRTSSLEFRRYVVTAIGSSDEMKVVGLQPRSRLSRRGPSGGVEGGIYRHPRMLHGLLQKWK